MNHVFWVKQLWNPHLFWAYKILTACTWMPTLPPLHRCPQCLPTLPHGTSAKWLKWQKQQYQNRRDVTWPEIDLYLRDSCCLKPIASQCVNEKQSKTNKTTAFWNLFVQISLDQERSNIFSAVWLFLSSQCDPDSSWTQIQREREERRGSIDFAKLRNIISIPPTAVTYHVRGEAECELNLHNIGTYERYPQLNNAGRKHEEMSHRASNARFNNWDFDFWLQSCSMLWNCW